MFMCGGSQTEDNTLPNLHMKGPSSAPHNLALGKGLGKHGHHQNAAFSFGWWHMKGAELPIV
jgi:hypothetical protein